MSKEIIVKVSFCEKFTAEYVWLDVNNNLRSKTKVMVSPHYNEVKDFRKALYDLKIPNWNYDGSSTGQATGDNSEVNLRPCAIFKDPFRRNNKENVIVLCDTYDNDGNPLKSNTRHGANKIFNDNDVLEHQPWFGLEQEYFIIDPTSTTPLGFMENQSTEQGQFYCSVGNGNAYGREIADEHLEACIYAGIKISGINAEVAPGQWEFQVGPCTGIDAGDHLWVARYILHRIAEKHGVRISFHPKPLSGNWNGSGCHNNFSTHKMRLDNGLNDICQAIEKLRLKHDEHMAVYGTENELRMTGEHETSRFDTFSFDINRPVNRGASIRVGHDTIKNKCGYFEDRRPSSNCDPYLVTSKIYETIMN